VVASSILNPGSIVRERSGGGSPSGAANFITGGSPLGRGIVSNAANKIVQFNRASVSGVAARPPDLGSMISTLSTNILNNVQNQVSSINNNVTQLVVERLAEVRENYRARLDKIDAARPNSILGNFLSLYREAIGYIQFLGNPKNVKTLGNNLRALQRIFRDTFRVGRMVRKTIGRIVKQLSGLPQATGGPGGINLDIRVPGGGLKRTAPRGIMRAMRRRPGMMLGGAALAGGLGTAVVSGMMDRGGGVQAAPSSEGAIPPVLLDRFGSILERFSKAIEHFASPQQSSGDNFSGGGSTTQQDPGQEDPGGTPGGGTPADVSGNYNAAEKAIIATVTQSEGTAGDKGYNTVYGGAVVPELTQMTLGELYSASKLGGDNAIPDRLGGGVIPYHVDEHNSSASGAPQLMPETLKRLVNSGRFSWDQTFDKNTQNAIIIALARDRLEGNPITAENVKKYIQPLGQEWASFTPHHGQTTTTAGETISLFEKNLRYFQGQPSTAEPAEPTVRSATIKREDQQQIAQTVSQPPASTTPQVTVAPMNLSSPQSQGGGGAGGGAPVVVGGGGKQPGPTVPFLSSSNNDNFLLLYSKMVYNIVDG
jgi:muramidase (phage lysozyme)